MIKLFLLPILGLLITVCALSGAAFYMRSKGKAEEASQLDNLSNQIVEKTTPVFRALYGALLGSVIALSVAAVMTIYFLTK